MINRPAPHDDTGTPHDDTQAAIAAARAGAATVRARCGRRPTRFDKGGGVLFTDGETARVRRDGHDTPPAPSAATRPVDVNPDPPFPDPRHTRCCCR